MAHIPGPSAAAWPAMQGAAVAHHLHPAPRHLGRVELRVALHHGGYHTAVVPGASVCRCACGRPGSDFPADQRPAPLAEVAGLSSGQSNNRLVPPARPLRIADAWNVQRRHLRGVRNGLRSPRRPGRTLAAGPTVETGPSVMNLVIEQCKLLCQGSATPSAGLSGCVWPHCRPA